MTNIKIDGKISARLVGTSVSPATKWDVEYWNFHPKQEPFASLGQVQLYSQKNRWHLWSGSITNDKLRSYGLILAKKRNGKLKR